MINVGRSTCIRICLYTWLETYSFLQGVPPVACRQPVAVPSRRPRPRPYRTCPSGVTQTRPTRTVSSRCIVIDEQDRLIGALDKKKSCTALCGKYQEEWLLLMSWRRRNHATSRQSLATGILMWGSVSGRSRGLSRDDSRAGTVGHTVGVKCGSKNDSTTE